MELWNYQEMKDINSPEELSAYFGKKAEERIYDKFVRMYERGRGGARKFARLVLMYRFGEGDYTPADEGEAPKGAEW